MVGREFRLWPLSAASPGPVVLFSLWEMLCEPSGKHRAVCKPQCETQTGVTVALKGPEKEKLNQMLISKGSKGPTKGGKWINTLWLW